MATDSKVIYQCDDTGGEKDDGTPIEACGVNVSLRWEGQENNQEAVVDERNEIRICTPFTKVPTRNVYVIFARPACP